LVLEEIILISDVHVGHVQTDWDIRLACLLLLALDQNDNFWQLYGDYLPGDDEITNLLLASEVGTF